ncbi:MAG: esterase family protein [Bryobacterales bacterium]|nr:esterase family protein [Bryobacterales bacterium]
MQREYHSWFSPILRRQMELLVFGHGGAPLIVFPTSMGRFYDYENRGMIGAIYSRYANGELHAFCVDSVDRESWYDKDIPPAARAERQLEYDAYLREEVLPFIAGRNPAQRVSVTGCSFGGYHSANFAFRHPELIDSLISFGGAFNIRRFLEGYFDDNCYFNNPPDFLPNIGDNTLLNEIRRLRIVLATGETDICLDENRRLSEILAYKGIPHVLDVWGDGAGHDWQWWERMAVKFFGK